MAAKRISTGFVMIAMVLLLLMSMVVQPTYAATVSTIPSTSTIVSANNKLKMNMSNYTATWTGVSHKVKTGSNGEKMLCIPIKSTGSSWTVNDFLDIKFTNAGIINGRQVDVNVHVNSMTVSARKGSSSGETSDGYMGVGSVWSNCLQFGTTINDGCGYKAMKKITYTATIYYHDTGATVNLPFFQTVTDIDSGASYYNEAWEIVSGYTGTFYKYSTNYNTFSGNKVSAPAGGNPVDGNNSTLKAGIYAPTSGGTFKGIFYEGNCGTQLNIYSQYSTSPGTFVTPKKSVDKARVKAGEPVTYSVKHTMGTFYKDTMTVYGSFIIKDQIPIELKYESAKITNGNGVDITNQGTLEYDNDTRTLTFTMGDSWRKTIGNYNGQVITLTINAKAGDIGDEQDVPVENVASIQYETEFKSNTNVVETIIYQDMQLQLRKTLDCNVDRLTYEHGRPIFIFKVSNDETGECFYKSVAFGEGDPADDGWEFRNVSGGIMAISPVYEVPYGKYSVKEIEVSRYSNVSSDIDVNGRRMTFSFKNSKDNWKNFSHNDIVINKLVKEVR